MKVDFQGRKGHGKNLVEWDLREDGLHVWVGHTLILWISNNGVVTFWREVPDGFTVDVN